MIVDDVGMAVVSREHVDADGGAAPALPSPRALVLVMLVKYVQMFVPQRPVLALKDLRIDRRP
jgi:hypothetical protein